MAAKGDKRLVRGVNHFVTLHGQGWQFSVVAQSPKGDVFAFASPLAAEWLSNRYTDAGVTFPAAIAASQLQVRFLELKIENGSADCSFAALPDKLGQAMVDALLTGLVDRKQYPFSGGTAAFSSVHSWYPEGAEYSSMFDKPKEELELILVSMVRHFSMRAVLTALDVASRHNPRLWSARELVMMRGVVQHCYWQHNLQEAVAAAEGAPSPHPASPPPPGTTTSNNIPCL